VSEGPLLEADVKVSLSRFSLDAAFGVGAGKVLGLVGPNGSGKTTALRALSGLQPLAGGRIALDGQVLEEPARHIRVSPERRKVGLMFQDYLLFPHMTAVDNVAFGLRARGVRRAAARERAEATLEGLGLHGIGAARPGSLSGGQQQRVAMARTLVLEPHLILLDEPLAALDVSTKVEVRRHLRRVLRGARVASVLVTHDLADAVAMADELVVLEGGLVVQRGTPAQVADRPRSTYVADLVGVTLLRGIAKSGVVTFEGGGELTVRTELEGPVLVMVRPSAVSITRDAPANPGPNTWRGTAAGIDLMGDRVRVRVEGTPTVMAEVAPTAVDQFRLDEGGHVWATADAAGITAYEA
jgi:molybdate transport system ATP-binding protein